MIRLRIHLTEATCVLATSMRGADKFILKCICGICRLNVELTMRKSVPPEQQMDNHLPERIATILVRSQHAGLVSKELSTRINYLLEIASLHTRSELLGQPGLGRLSVNRVEKWMKFHGRRLRLNEESLDSVICRFGFGQGFIEEKANRSAAVSVISPEDRDKILRELGSFGMGAEQLRRPERRMSMSQNN